MFSIDLRLDLVKEHFVRIECCIDEDLVSNDSE